MSSYNQWLTARGNEYKVALASAYAAHTGFCSISTHTTQTACQAAGGTWTAGNPTGSPAAVAYGALVSLAAGNSQGWTNTILNNLRAGSTNEAEILVMQDWLAYDYANNSGTHAAALGLAIQTAVDTGARNALGGQGVEGGQYRRWKGQPLYTFGEGLLVGKSNQVIAVFGDHPAEISSAGFGTDGLIFFDGKPMSKNTTTPGTVVMGGDLMVSGSIRGDGGVVVIDDVIQLETGVANPAGIALDSAGKIKLRHRGMGFTQFIDPALTQQAAEDAAKVWVSAQNTDATRLADSMIPNSNFDVKEYFQVSGTYYQRPAGVAAVGTTVKESISYPSGQAGILKMNPDSDSSFGFIMPAVDVSEGGYEGKFNVKIRFSSDSGTPINQGATQGIFIVMCETDATPTQFADKKYVYDTTSSLNITGQHESRSDYYETNVTFTSLTSPSLSIPSDGNWSYQSYDFVKQSSTTYVSLLVYVQNVGAASLYVDYVSMKPAPPSKSVIEGLVTNATSNIATEAGSLIQGASLENVQSSYDNVPTNFIKIKPTAAASYATFASASGDQHSDYGGSDDTDKGVSITTTSVVNLGMVSQAFDRDALLYTVGARIRALANNTTIKIFAVETNFDTTGSLMDPSVISFNLPSGYVTDASSAQTASGTRVDIKLAELTGSGTYNAQDSDPITVTKSPSDGWVTVLGTYKPTRTANGQDSPVRKISIAIEVTSTSGSVAIDFLYCARQTSTSDIASTLADEAYSDSQTYVSLLNSFVAKEQGSLIPNAQMGVQEFIKGSGSSVANHIRPSGFRYLGFNSSANSGNGDGYLLSYAPEASGIGKDAVMKVALGGTTDFSKGVTTPPFPVGTDRYAVIIRARRDSADGVIRAGINYTTGTLASDKSTIAASSITINSTAISPTYEPDVQTGSVSFQELTLNDNTLDSSMTNYVATWDLVGSNLASPNVADYDQVQLASLTIVATKDFYIDYLYVVPQTISANIAELNDNVVRNFFNNINELAEQENDSLIGNGNFTIPKATNTILPSSWFPTANTDFQFVQHGDATTTATYIASSLNGNGTVVGLKYSGTKNATTGPNIYSGILNLPNPSSYTDSDGNPVSGALGQKYTVFAKVRTHAGSGNKARVYLRYHEYDSPITNQTHIYDTTKASVDASNGQVSTRSNDINCANITANSDNGQDYEDVVSTSWQVIGGTYTATSTAKHVGFSIQVTFPDNDIPTANSASGEPTTFFYIDYFYVGVQTMTQDIAVALAQAEADIKIGPIQNSINNLNNLVELEDPSLSLITNSTFANLYDTGDPDLAKYWIATRSTKDAIEVYPNGTGGISSIGTYATPYNATGEADNNYGMLSKLIVEPALAVTTHSFDALGLSTSSLGKYNVIVRCRGTETTSTQYTTSSIVHTYSNAYVDSDGNSYTSFHTFSEGGRSYSVASDTTVTYIDVSGDWSTYTITAPSAPAGGTFTGTVYYYFGLHCHVVEGSDKLRIRTRNNSGTLLDMGDIAIHYSTGEGSSYTPSWTAATFTDDGAGTLEMTRPYSGAGIIRMTFTNVSNIDNLRKINFSNITGTSDTTDRDYWMITHGVPFWEYTTVTQNPYSVQVIAHEKYTAVSATATHLLQADASVTSPDTNIGVVLDTFTNNNSDGKSTTLNAIDLGNNSATAGTTQNITTNTASWRNVLATYTPDPRAHAVSFEFRFDSDQDTDGNDAIVYVDSVHMEVSTVDQDLVVALANERAETAETMANNAAIAQGSAAQQAAALILAAAQSEAAQSRDNINASVSSEQGSIMYNSAFAYSNVYGASDGGVTTSKTGAMTVTINSTNATKQGQYKIEMTSTGSTSTSQGGIVTNVPAKYKLYKHDGSSFVTIKNPSTGSEIIFDSSTNTVPLHDTGITIAWNQVYGAVVGDNYSWTTTVQQRPIGYRLGRVTYTASDYLIRNNLHYNELPDSTAIGGAKIQISENRTGGVNLSGEYSLLCPPILTPSDGQKTGYEVAVKLKSESGDSSQTIGIRIHELYEYFDQDTYVTFCANKSNAKNLTTPAGALDDAGATIATSTAFNVDTAKGIDDGSSVADNSGTRKADTDVYMFPPSNRNLPKRSVINGWTGYDSSHADWPIGSTQDVTVLKLSEFDTTSGTTENYGTTFTTIGGGFDTKEDTKMFVVELIFTQVDDAKSTIIDYIHVSPSTIGAGAAAAIATANAQSEISSLLNPGGGSGNTSLANYLTENDYTIDGATAADITTAKEEVNQTVANMKETSLQPNGTFVNWVTQATEYSGNASTKFPTGFSLHRYTNANTNVNSASDLRKKITYASYTTSTGVSTPLTYVPDDPQIAIVNDGGEMGLVCPFILASQWGSAEGLMVAVRFSTNHQPSGHTLKIRCHQSFKSPVDPVVNGVSTSKAANCVLQSGTYTFTSNNVTYDNFTNYTESTVNNRSPSAMYFKGIDPQATKAMADGAGNTDDIGVVYELNLIDLLDPSDTSATNSVDYPSSANHNKLVGGSCRIHPDAVAVSFEIITDLDSGYALFDEIAVTTQDVFVDAAHLKAADRVLDIAEDIEEEEAAQLTNVILNPKGSHTYKPNSRYEVPRNWRYLGEQPYGVGYRSSKTGALLDKPLPRGRKLMSLGIIGERGIAQRNSSDYINQGMVSKPWRVEDDMYEWEIELDISSGNYEGVRIFVLEYDTATKPQWLKPHHALAWNSSIDATTMYGGGTATAATRQVCLHHNAAANSGGTDWDFDASNDYNGVKYDGGNTPLDTYSITETTVSSGATSTIGSDQIWLKWNTTGRFKYEGKYIPTSTTKYAALWICTWSATSKLVVYNVEMNTDKTSTTAISLRNTRLGLGNFAGKTPRTALTDQYTVSTYFQALKLSAMTFTETSGKAPSLEGDDIQIWAGESSAPDGSPQSPYTDRWLSQTVDRTSDGGSSGTRTDRLRTVQETVDTVTGVDRSRFGGMVFAQPRIFYNDSQILQDGRFCSSNGTCKTIHAEGVSYFYPEASSYIGVRDEDFDESAKMSDASVLVLKQKSQDGPQLIFSDYNSTTNRWGLKYDNGGHLDFDKNGSTKAYIHGTNNVADLNFTGQHRNTPLNDDVLQASQGLIVISTGVYDNVDPQKEDKPTINEALPVVTLSSKRNEKSVFGVISNKEDYNNAPGEFTREYMTGAIVSVIDRKENDSDRLIINSVGEGAIWICNINGNLENGDYITTCEVPGYGMLQDDDLLHNYTVAKITQDCDFELDNPNYDCVEFEFEGQTYRKAFVGCTYHCG